MRILWINNDGGGFADYVDVPSGRTVQELFQERIPYGQARDYLIRVNRQPCASEQVLQEGDRVSVTPTKIEGASSPAGRRRRAAGRLSPATQGLAL